MARKIVTPQLDGLPQNAVHLNQLALHGPLPREAQQILDDILRPLGFLQDNFQILLRRRDRKSTRLNSSHQIISYAVFCSRKKRSPRPPPPRPPPHSP